MDRMMAGSIAIRIPPMMMESIFSVLVAGAFSALLLAGVSSVVVSMTGAYPALPSGFGGSCRSLIAAYMSAAFTCVAFLSLSVGFW